MIKLFGQIFLMLLFFSTVASARDKINNIFINTGKVFERSDSDWFFASPFLNSLHITTKKYIIKDELIFRIGNELDEDDFLETERNLRALGLFTKISIELEEVSNGLFDVYVETKDKWSLYPGIIVGASGGEYVFGARLKDYNLLGHGIMFNIDGAKMYKTVSNTTVNNNADATSKKYDTTGYIGNIELEKKRLFRSELGLFARAYKTYLSDGQEVIFEKPFRTINTKTSYGISASNSLRNDYFSNKGSILFNGVQTDGTVDSNFLRHIDTLKFIKSNEQKAQIWYAKSWQAIDKVYFSTSLEWQQSDRMANVFERVYDNQSKFLIGFSSVAQTYYTVNNINAYNHEDLAVGGWGNVVLGAIFPSNKRGENGFFYVGAQGEKSYYSKNFYLFGQITASSSFAREFAKYTYQEFLGLAFVRLTDKLLFAARIREQASWNYPRMRQLFVDDIRGIRGYDLQKLSGDNRLVSNFELRYFPALRIFVMQFSGVAFFDIGSVWNQRVEDAFLKSRFYSSAGLGLRGHFTKSNNPDHILRLDIPYNFYTKRFGISLGVAQYFSAISSHIFKIPTIYSKEFDRE